MTIFCLFHLLWATYTLESLTRFIQMTNWHCHWRSRYVIVAQTAHSYRNTVFFRFQFDNARWWLKSISLILSIIYAASVRTQKQYRNRSVCLFLFWIFCFFFFHMTVTFISTTDLTLSYNMRTRSSVVIFWGTFCFVCLLQLLLSLASTKQTNDCMKPNLWVICEYDMIS